MAGFLEIKRKRQMNEDQKQIFSSFPQDASVLNNFLLQYKNMSSNFNDSTLESIFSNQKAEDNNEKKRISARMSNFQPKECKAWKEITQKFGTNIKQQELLSIANVLSTSAKLKLDRDAKRRKTVLIKWFDENWDAIKPYLPYVVLENANQ